MRDVIAWWVTVQVLAALFYPLTVRLLRGLPDRGYSLAKTLGLLFPAYFFWLLSSFGFLDNNRTSIIAVILVASLLSWLLVPGAKDTLVSLWRSQRRTLILVELLFAGALSLWALMRALGPNIAATEKPMEFAFLNGVLRSDAFPPIDPWLSGNSISYYYFGYVIVGMLTKITALPSSTTFNLAIALLFALTVTGAFGIAYNLARAADGSSTEESQDETHPSPEWTTGESQPQGIEIRHRQPAGIKFGPIWCGAIGALFTAVMGNLEGVLEIIYARSWLSPSFWNWVGIQNLDKPYVSQYWYPSDWMWWFRASRVISDYDPVSHVARDYTINEFPFFSFFLGDLHPHVLALPFTLVVVGLGLSLLLSRSELRLESLRKNPWDFLGFSLIVGGLGFLNSWDMPTFALLLAGSFGLKGALASSRLEWSTLKEPALFLVLLVVASVALYLPFYVGFHSQASGIGIVLVQSKMHHFLILWAPFIFLSGAFVLSHLPSIRRAAGSELPTYALVIVCGLLVILLVFRVWVILLLLAMLVAGYFALQAVVESETDSVSHRRMVAGFVISLIMLGAFLLLGTEVLFVRDLFGNRMNTVFKVYYQAWLLISVAGAYVVYYFLNSWATSRRRDDTETRPLVSPSRTSGERRILAMVARASFAIGLILVVMTFAYPVAAISSRMAEGNGELQLDGTAYMARTQRDDYDAMKWLEQNVRGMAVILEAVGGSYSEYGRVSATTGLPTVLGWDGHEVQWRGSGEETAKRKADVDRIYETTDGSIAAELLKRYRVDYVYVGPLERQKYSSTSPAWLDKFSLLGDIVYQNSGVTIFRIRVGGRG